MSDVLHEHARMLARNLLRLQICTIGEIAETLELELEPPEVQELAVEVYDERAEQLTALRQIMNDIKEGRAGRQQQEALLFDAIGILNQCLHRREPGRRAGDLAVIWPAGWAAWANAGGARAGNPHKMGILEIPAQLPSCPDGNTIYIGEKNK